MASADFSCNNNSRGARLTSAPAVIELAENGFIGDSIVDGPGLRCVVFCQGCPHGCAGCHNPATHPFGCGKAEPVLDIYNQIQKYPLCRAVTFSGGEPFCQSEGFASLARLLKKGGYELAAYTGYTFEQLLAGPQEQQDLLGLLDTLIDGPYIHACQNLNLRFRGSTNQRILNVPHSLESGKAVLENHPRWTG